LLPFSSGTWFLAQGEEHRLKLSENTMLRGTLGPKRGRMTQSARTLHNEELHNLHCSPNIIRALKHSMIRAGHVAQVKEIRNAYKISAGGPDHLRNPNVDWGIILKRIVMKNVK
jgi:hypothetical protein